MRPIGSDSRRAAIAETSIAIVAERGVRALTHRAVDSAAGLPPGSTSYYAKTRSALLALIVDTLAGRSLADAEGTGRELTPRAEPLTVDALAEMLGILVTALADRRDDMRARYALLLELDDPLLLSKLTTDSEVHRLSLRVTTEALELAGIDATQTRVREVLALADALVFQQVALPDAVSPAPIIRSFLAGLVAGS